MGRSATRRASTTCPVAEDDVSSRGVSASTVTNPPGKTGVYTAAKAAQENLVLTLSAELKDQGVYEVGPGDTLYFPSTTQHRWWAAEEAVEAVYVNTPPTF